MKIIAIIALVLCVVLLLSCLFSFCDSDSDNGGDGKTSCKNCGKKSVVALGYCERCYKSFREYTYGKK